MLLLRYAISGGSAALAHLAVLILLVEEFGSNPTLSSAIGFCVAIAVNYTLQYYWTFRADGSHGSTFARYVSVTLLMLVVNTGLFWFINTRIGLGYVIAQAIAILFVFTINFEINRRFTFRVTGAEHSQDRAS